MNYSNIDIMFHHCVMFTHILMMRPILIIPMHNLIHKTIRDFYNTHSL